MPSVGLVQVRDAETDRKVWINTSDKSLRSFYRQSWDNNQKRLNELFKKCGVDNTKIGTDQDYVKPLMQLFNQR
jgi:hypothetical protein